MANRIARFAIPLILFAGIVIALPSYAREERPLISIEPLHGDFGLEFNDFELKAKSKFNSSKTDIGFFSEALNLRNRVVVFHPRFLELDLGAGLRLSQGRGDEDGNDTEATRYFVSANFLKAHPYSFKFFYRKFDSEQVNSPTSISLVEQKDYGLNIRLKEKLGIPVPITVQYQKLQQNNDSTFIPFDVQNPIALSFRFDQTITTRHVISRKNWDHVNLSLKFTRREVERRQDNFGNLDLVEYRRDEFAGNLSGRAGTKDRFRWNLSLNRQSQTDFPIIESSQTRGNGTFKILDLHASTLSFFLGLNNSQTETQTLDFSTREIETRTTESESVEGAFIHRLFRSLFTDLRVRRRETISTDHTLISTHTRIGTRYIKQIPDGKITATYSFSDTDSVNTGQRRIVTINEPHVITSALPFTFALNSQNVILEGIPTPGVFDLSRRPVVTDQAGNTFDEGIDYIVNQIGPTTFIQIVTPLINVGDTVLVDYTYSIPISDVSTATRDYSLGMRWRFIETNVRISNTEVQIFEGSEEDRLLHNPGKKTVYGVKLREKLWNRITPDFTFEVEKNRRAIGPFNRTSRTAALAIEIAKNSGVSFYHSNSTIEQLEADDDSDLTTNGADFYFKRGSFRGLVGFSRLDSLIGKTRRETSVLNSTGFYSLGRWTLDATVRRARESFRNPDISNSDFDRKSSSLKIAIRRIF